MVWIWGLKPVQQSPLWPLREHESNDGLPFHEYSITASIVHWKVIASLWFKSLWLDRISLDPPVKRFGTSISIHCSTWSVIVDQTCRATRLLCSSCCWWYEGKWREENSRKHWRKYGRKTGQESWHWCRRIVAWWRNFGSLVHFCFTHWIVDYHKLAFRLGKFSADSEGILTGIESGVLTIDDASPCLRRCSRLVMKAICYDPENFQVCFTWTSKMIVVFQRQWSRNVQVWSSTLARYQRMTGRLHCKPQKATLVTSFGIFFQRIKDDEEVVWKAIQSDADFMLRAVRIHPAFFFSLRRVIYGTIVK